MIRSLKLRLRWDFYFLMYAIKISLWAFFFFLNMNLRINQEWANVSTGGTSVGSKIDQGGKQEDT